MEIKFKSCNRCQTDVHPDSYLLEVGSLEEQTVLDIAIEDHRWATLYPQTETYDFHAGFTMGKVKALQRKKAGFESHQRVTFP